MVPAFAELAPTNGLGRETPKLIVYQGEASASPNGVETLAGQDETFRRWNVTVTPFFAAVDPEGRVVAAGPAGSVSVLNQLARAIERRENVASKR